MPTSSVEELLERVAADPPRIVCLPDLFLDHIVELPDWDAAHERIEACIDRGGGNLLDTPQAIHPGGNAANTAWQLARLGVDVQLAGVGSPALVDLFEGRLGRDGVDLSLVDERQAPSLTTVLRVGDPPANAMMNDPGALATYGPSDLDRATRRAIEEADAVLVANWASMRDHGTQLVADVLELAHRSGTFAYVDAADPSERSENARDALVEALTRVPPDAWAMNENEAMAFAAREAPDDAATRLAKRTGTRIDVHTHEHALTVFGDAHARIEAFPVEGVQRTTGAGDAFNAGNLIGHLLEAEAGARLRLAHAVAGCFVSRDQRRPPDEGAVAGFLDAVNA